MRQKIHILVYSIVFSFFSFFLFISYDIFQYNSKNYFEKITQNKNSQYAINLKEKNKNINDDKGLIINDNILEKQKAFIKSSIVAQIEQKEKNKKVGTLIDIQKQSLLQKDEKLIELNKQDFVSLDDFMDKNILFYDEQVKKELISDKNFKYLTEKLVNLDDFFIYQIKDGNNAYETLRKMQKLSIYLSKTYAVNLNEIEKIVLLSYKESYHHKIDPALLLSIISVESSFRKNAQSWAGAIGLTQVIPYWHQDKIQKFNLNVTNMEDNITLGAKIIKEYIMISGGNIVNGLQRYNGSLHDSTRKYSTKVIEKMQKIKTMI